MSCDDDTPFLKPKKYMKKEIRTNANTETLH